jgi:hypothetical protein
MMDIEDDFQTYNHGHQIEGMDRCMTILSLLDTLLTGHPAVVRAEGDHLVREAFDAVMTLYQEIANIDESPDK